MKITPINYAAIPEGTVKKTNTQAEFESLLWQMMLKQLGSVSFGNEEKSNAEKLYTSLLQQEYSLKLAEKYPIFSPQQVLSMPREPASSQ